MKKEIKDSIFKCCKKEKEVFFFTSLATSKGYKKEEVLGYRALGENFLLIYLKKKKILLRNDWEGIVEKIIVQKKKTKSFFNYNKKDNILIFCQNKEKRINYIYPEDGYIEELETPFEIRGIKKFPLNGREDIVLGVSKKKFFFFEKILFLDCLKEEIRQKIFKTKKKINYFKGDKIIYRKKEQIIEIYYKNCIFIIDFKESDKNWGFSLREVKKN